MGKKSGSSAPQADPNIGLAAMKQAQLGEDWLAVVQDQFKVSTERQKGLDAVAKEVTQTQLDASKQAAGWATEDRNRSKTVFQPLQDEFIKTANGWDSPEKLASVAAEAKADVLGAGADQRAANQRSMAAMGINPASGRFAGIDRAGDTNIALASAGAQNNARSTVRNQAVALKADAVNMGNGLGVNPATSLGLGVNAGTSAAGTTAGANAASDARVGMLGDGYKTAMGGYTNQAGILQSQYNSQLSAWNAQQQADSSAIGGLASGIGSLAGMAFFSDENAKTEKKPAKGVLKAVRSMPVEEWTYKPGAGDGGRHIGPYAQDFQKATGKGDGKSINVIDAIGVTMGAVQELADKVDKITSPKARGIGARPSERMAA